MSDAKGQKADPLVGFLQSPRALIRVHAAEDMGWSRNEAYVPLLEKASVEDPDERVRQAACVALGKISTQEAAEFLIGLLDHPKAPTVGVLRGLALTRRPEVVEPIIKAYGREGFPRREAVEALLEIGGARVEAFLRERLPLERGPVREVIVEALARLRDRASAQVLMASFFEDPASQLQAVRALEKIGGPEAVRFLARIAVEPETNPAARRTALRALKEMPESKEEAAEVLRRAALSRQPAVAQAARQALKFLGLSPPLEPPPMGEPEEGGLKPLPPLGQPPPQPSSRGQIP
jgi:HEAT repeat protein